MMSRKPSWRRRGGSLRAMFRSRIVGVVAVVLATTPLLWLLVRGEPPVPRSSPRTSLPAPAAPASPWETATRKPLQAERLTPTGQPPSTNPRPSVAPSSTLSLEDSLAALADGLRAGEDTPQELAGLLRDPETPWRILDLLQAPAAGDDAGIHAAAVFVLGIILENASRFSESLPAWRSFETGAFVEALLDAIPRVAPSAQASFVATLVLACGLEGSPLDSGRIFEVERLRLLHPEEEGYRRLLVRMMETGEPSLLEAFALRSIGEDEDGELREASLALLLRRDPDLFLPLALTLLDQEHQRPRVRHPAAQAIARELPPDQALELLVPRIDDPNGGLFLPWGSDAPRREAAARAYRDLLDAKAHPTARAALLDAGLGEDGPNDWILLAAGNDPDPRVRGRAWITLSARGDTKDDALDDLRSAYFQGRIDGKSALAASLNWAGSHPDGAQASAGLASEILRREPKIFGPQGGSWLREQFSSLLTPEAIDRLFPL